MPIGTNLAMTPHLSLGPLLYPWSQEQIKALYVQAANLASLKRIYLGEIVCAKRAPLFNKLLATLVQQLLAAHKEIVITTPILQNDAESYQLMRSNIEIAQQYNLIVEVNDLATLKYAQELPIILGPYLNIYNQATLKVFNRYHPLAICPAFECNREVLIDLAQAAIPLEVNVFGHLPLAISSRCFTARSLQITRETCKLVCFKHSNGQLAYAEPHEPLWIINGMQVQSAKIYNLIYQIPSLIAKGINYFRINPLKEFTLNETITFIQQSLNQSVPHRLDSAIFANGFYYSQEGYQLVEASS